MNIKSPNQLKEAIELAISGNKEILYDIARYVAYNYYMYTHIKKDSKEDMENEQIYSDFRENHVDLYKEVEEIVDMIYNKE